MILLHIDNDPARVMNEFDRMMYGLDVIRARCGFSKLALFAPHDLALVKIDGNRYHPLSLIFGVESYKEACAMFGISPHGTKAQAYGFCATMPEGATYLRLIDGIWVPRTRALEIMQLNALWQAEFRDEWSALSLSK